MHPTTLRSLQWIAIILVITGVGVAYFLTRTKAAVIINTSQNTQQTGSLVGLWSFNGPDVSGTTAYDRSGASHNGTLTNTPTVIEGKVGQALNFNGTNQYVSVGNVGSGVQSISFWIKASNVTQKIIDLGGSANIEVVAQTITANGFTSPTIYVDGVVSSFIDTNWHFVTITTATGINASAVNIGRVGSGYFNGRLDEVRMYSNAVSSSQITSLYSSGGSVSGVIPPPIISAISFGTPGYTTATITWTTNTVSTSYVEYGITTGYGTTTGSATPVTSHSVALSGLSSATTYHFRVHSVNASGQEGLSADNTFSTDGPTVAISAISSGTPGYTTATITWTTDVTSDSYVDYGLTTGYSTTVGSATLVTSHSVALSGLTQGTIYHFRVHSSKAGSFDGISGDNTVTTATSWACGNTITYGGHNYPTVQISSQCWMRENLNVGTMIAGSAMPADSAPTLNDPSTVSKWCYFDSETNCTNEGGLYSWAEANDLASTCNTTSCTPAAGNQGICPTGWHIPTDTEYYTMENYLKTGATCNAARSGWDCDGAGTSMKTISSTTLSVPLAGYRSSDGSFNGQTTSAGLWSASEDSTTNAWRRYLGSNPVTVGRYTVSKAYGYSVRCLKD